MSADRPADMAMRDVIELQRGACEHAGSVLYAALLGCLRDDHDAGGITAEVLAPYEDDALANAIPLRLLAAVHHIVLDGREQALAAWFPSVGGDATGDPGPALLDALHRHRDEIGARMDAGVQTNEVGRAASLVGGFHEVARRTGLALRCLEIGSSAGLLQRWDHFFYRRGDCSWGDPTSAIRFVDVWDGDGPTFHAGTRVVHRRGCDIAPIDVATDAGVHRVRSFLWPDQLERRTRLDHAIDIARRVPAVIDQADAGRWVETMLRDPALGTATVVFHSIVLQYLPRPTFERLRSAITKAGERAGRDAPIAWLRMEPAGEVAEVRLQLWPGGEDRQLATTAYHGPPVKWLGGTPVP